LQATEEKQDMDALQESNRRILFNLLPSHVATHFLDNQFRTNTVSAAPTRSVPHQHGQSRTNTVRAAPTRSVPHQHGQCRTNTVSAAPTRSVPRRYARSITHAIFSQCSDESDMLTALRLYESISTFSQLYS
jgi:hypothetical protein